MNSIQRFAVFFVIILISSWHIAGAKVGYDLHVIVNEKNSSKIWSRSHETTPFSFTFIGNCKGDGNSSKYIRINDLSGINLKEDVFTKQGRLKEDRKITSVSRANWVYIDESVSNNSGLYTVEINESMPSNLLDVENIAYRGEGIYKRNSFINNEDEFETQYQAKRFTESSSFLAVYRNALITASVTPYEIKEFAGENYSSLLQIDSESDIFSMIKFKSDMDFMESRYVGYFELKSKISKTHSFQKIQDEDMDDWLICCSLGAASLGLDYPFQASWQCLCRSALSRISTEI